MSKPTTKEEASVSSVHDTDGAGIIRLPLKKLKFHPLLAKVAMLDDAITYLEENRKADPGSLQEKLDFRAAFKASLKEEGIKNPILAVKHGNDWLIVNGRHRKTYGLEVGLKDAPVMEVTEETARQTILRENGLTWARTKSAVAWLAVSLHPEVVDTPVGRPANSQTLGITRSELAAQIGVAVSLIDYACSLWKKVRNSETLRAKTEVRIAAGIGVAQLNAGFEGEKSLPTGKDGKLKRPASSVPGLCRTLATVSTQLKEWDKWSDEQRELAATRAAELFDDGNGFEFLQAVMRHLQNA